jgi:4-hydroxy-tetrahydrodipicolinate reductase
MEAIPLPVLFFGLGTIGRGALSRALADPGLEVVGAVDIDPDLLGLDIGDLAGFMTEGVTVTATLDGALAAAEAAPQVAIHATSSYFEGVAPQVRALVDAGMHVVTCCEEMLFPLIANTALARELDDLATQANVTIYPAGINPGFVLDRLPAFLLRVITSVRSIDASRRLDTLLRRPQLRAKTGAGLSVSEFQTGVNAGEIGHVGLPETLLHLTTALRADVVSSDHQLGPIVAENDVETPEGTIQRGRVLGALEQLEAELEGGIRVELALQMSVGADDPSDRIIIDGDPPIDLQIRGGIAGDAATASSLVAGARLVLVLPPGLQLR